MAKVLPLVAVLVPLTIVPGLLFYFDVTPKVVLVVLGLCLALPAAGRNWLHLLQSRGGAWFVWLTVLQLLSLALATAVSADRALSIGGSNWRRFGFATHTATLLFALLAAAVLAREPQRLIAWLRVLCAAGVLAALYGGLQYFGWDPWLPVAAYHIGEGEWAIVRPPSTLGHAGYAATLYLHAAFAGVALLFADPSRTSRLLGVSAAALASVAMVLSGTRGAMLGWLLGVLLLAYWTRPVLRRRHFVAIAVAVAAAIAFYCSPPGQKLRSRARWSAEDARGGARLELWRDSARMGAARWLTGWGPEVFPSEFPRYQSPELARAFPDFYHESPHNIFLEAWTAQGLLGAAVLLGFSALGLRAARHSTVQSALCAGLAAAVVAQQFVSFTVPTALFFYVTLALIVAQDDPLGGRRPIRLSSLVLIPIAVLLVYYAVQLFVSDRLLRVTQTQLNAGRLADASVTYDRARWWQPVGANSDLWFSRSLLEAARRSRLLPEASLAMPLVLQAARRAALHAEDRHNALYHLSSLCAIGNDFPGVETNLRLAIAAAPNWFKPHWTLAQALALAGRRDEAGKEAALAVDLDGGKHPEVWQTIQRLDLKK